MRQDKFFFVWYADEMPVGMKIEIISYVAEISIGQEQKKLWKFCISQAIVHLVSILQGQTERGIYFYILCLLGYTV